MIRALTEVVPRRRQSWPLKSLENFDLAPNAQQDVTYKP